MTTKSTSPRTGAYLLVVAGLILLLANLGLLGWVWDWLWALVFVAGGVGFLYHYRTRQEHWWALIPGFALFAVGLTIVSGEAGGSVFLGLLGAGFASVYLTDRGRWWAVIPGGVLLTLAAVAWFDGRWPGWDGGLVFFLGLAATFGTLYLLPEGEGKQRWAAVPALALLVLALVIGASGAVTGIVIPLLLVALGAYLFWRQGGMPKGPDAAAPQGGVK